MKWQRLPAVSLPENLLADYVANMSPNHYPLCGAMRAGPPGVMKLRQATAAPYNGMVAAIADPIGRDGGIGRRTRLKIERP
jgi:hypothetical protein